MMNRILGLILPAFLVTCGSLESPEGMVITSDIDRFWNAYDRVVQETDTLRQVRLFDSLYVDRGSAGLRGIMEAREYTAEGYVALINAYPTFWTSIRPNTLKSKGLARELDAGIEKLRVLYPELKPARIYFTVGAMRTNGTTRDSLVLIGSELAMGDSTVNTSEFEGVTGEWLANYFGGNPIDGVVLLNLHEYVHTQQHPIPDNLLYQVLYEGVAEFVSTLALGVPSDAPAIAFGRNTPAVRRTFEEEMFYERTYEWMWSNAPNDFSVRDLGYYIGYAIAERHYRQASDKATAIRELIGIDYAQADAVDALIDSTQFFSRPIRSLRELDRWNRPGVTAIREFANGSRAVDPERTTITVDFSEALDGYHTGVDYGPGGPEAFPTVVDRYWSPDSAAWTLAVELLPDTRYELLISSNFRRTDGVPLTPYRIDFTTRSTGSHGSLLPN